MGESKRKSIAQWRVCLFLLCLCVIKTSAQNSTQAWFDFQVDYPFKSQYLFEMETSYQTKLTKDSAWRSMNLTPTLQYSYFSSVDFSVTVPLSYTAQTKDYDSFEARPTLEACLHITQNKQVNSRLVFKAEERLFLNLEDDDWETSTRLRLKLEFTIAINGRNLYKDKLWYAITDYEEFFVVDEHLDERYANLRRARIGAGYRLDYKNRFEMIYTLQSSRNEIEEEFTSIDNVVQLRYKMFLNPAKPVPPKND
jgi:hypothetical protein